MSQATCYMCNSPATSREHVPPRCMFPEFKDVGGNYRQNLITVPSCDIHNSGKAEDDEFLMVSLAGIIGNNSIGYAHKFTKVNRAIHRTAFSLLDKAIKDQKWSMVEFGPNKFIDVVWGTPDYPRLLNCFDRVARGIHLAHFGQKFIGRSGTLLGYTSVSEPNPAQFQAFIRDKVAIELAGKQYCGENPAIFRYQFTDPDQVGVYLVHLQFYGGVDIYVSLIPDGVDLPAFSPALLIEGGIKTIVTLGDKQYTFND